MKSITEFASFTLAAGLKAKAALTADGKTPEETQTSLGETFKYEGEKLQHFVNALEVGGQHTENLKRVLVMSLVEGENVPAKALKVEEVYYVPEFHVTAKPASQAKDQGKGKGGGRGGDKGKGKGGGGRGGGAEKESPWGMSPEQLAAKKGKGGGAAKTK